MRVLNTSTARRIPRAGVFKFRGMIPEGTSVVAPPLEARFRSQKSSKRCCENAGGEHVV